MNDKLVKELLEKQKIKIQLIEKPYYNIFSEGQVIHPSAGTIFLIRKVKLNAKKTWIEFKGCFNDNPEKKVTFSINPENIELHLKIF